MPVKNNNNSNNNVRNNSIYKFFLYLIIVMFVPLIFLGAMVYVDTKAEYIESSEKYIQEQINNVSINIENAITQSINIYDRLKDNKYFYDYQLAKSPGSVVYIQDELLNIIHTLPFNGDFCYYNLNTDYIYSYVVEKTGTYLSKLPGASDAFVQEVTGKLSEIGPNLVSDLDDDYEYSWYIQSFEDSQGESISGLIYQIPDKYFDQMLSQVQYIDFSQTTIYIENSPAYTNFGGEELATSGIELSAKSGAVEITYLIDESYVVGQFGSVIFSLFLALLISIAIGGVVIFLQYKPVKELSLVVNNLLIGSSKRNLFTDINMVMNNLIQENYFVNLSKAEAQELNEKMLIKNTLLTLISSNLHERDPNDIEIFKKSLEKANKVKFKYDNFLCLIFEGNGYNLDSYFSDDNIDFYSLDIEEMGNTVLIVSSKVNSFNSVDKLVDNLLKSIVEKNEIPLSIGIGTFTQKLYEINNSFDNALTALDYCSSLNKNIVYYSEVNQIDIYSYSTCVNIIAQFSQALESKNITKLLRLNKEIKSFSGMTKNILTLHSICLELLFICRKSEKVVFNKEELENYKHGFFNSVFTKNNYIEFLNWIESEIEMELGVGKEFEKIAKNNTLNVEKIQEFININITDPNLSVTFIADNFSTTGSNLSHYYKKNTGTTILEYINTAKMNFAKKMLLETDYSFSKICEMIGYYYPSNLIRKFKSLEGMTPSEFRKKNNS